MKKVIIFIISMLTIICVTIMGLFMYKTSTPEYALAKTIADIKESDISGLEEHLTDNARENVEKVVERSEYSLVSGILSVVSQSDGISLLKSKISEIDWSVEDILKGNQNAEVVIGFNYNEQITGTINIIMIYENRQWKIDSIGIPSFDNLFD